MNERLSASGMLEKARSNASGLLAQEAEERQKLIDEKKQAVQDKRQEQKTQFESAREQVNSAKIKLAEAHNSLAEILTAIEEAETDDRLKLQPKLLEQLLTDLKVMQEEGQLAVSLAQEEIASAERHQAEVERKAGVFGAQVRANLEKREIPQARLEIVWHYVERERENVKKYIDYQNLGKRMGAKVKQGAQLEEGGELVIDEFGSEIEAIKAEIEALKKELAEQEKRLPDATVNFGETDVKSSVEERKLKELESRVSALRREIDNQEHFSGRDEAELEKLRAELEKTRLNLDLVKKNYHTAQAGFETWLALEYDPLQAQLADLKVAQEKFTQKILYKRQELTNLQSQLNKDNKDYDALANEISKAEREISNQRQWETQAKYKLGEVQKERKAWREKWGAENLQLVTRENVLEKDLSSEGYPDKIAKLQEGLKTLQEKAVTLLAEKNEKAKKVTELDGEIRKLAHDDPTRKIQELESKLRTLEREKKEKERRVSELKERPDRSQREIDSQTKKIDEKAIALATEKAENEKKRREKLAPAEVALEAQTTVVELAKKKAADASVEYTTLNYRIRDLARTLSLKQYKYDQKNRDVAKQAEDLKNPQVYKAFVNGFAEEFGSPEFEGAETKKVETVVLKLGDERFVLWGNSQMKEVEALPEVPAEIAELGGNSLKLIQEAVTNPQVSKDDLEKKLSVAEVVPGYLDQTLSDAETENKAFVAEKIKAKQAEIDGVRDLEDSLRQSVEELREKSQNLLQLDRLVGNWQYEQRQFELAVKQLTELENQKSELEFSLKQAGMFAFGEKRNLESQITKKALEIEAQKTRVVTAKQKTYDEEEKVNTLNSEAIGETEEFLPGTQIKRKVLTLDRKDLPKQAHELLEKATEAENRARVLERVGYAWKNGKMLNYSQEEADFALAEVKTVGTNREENVLDQMANEVARKISEYLSDFDNAKHLPQLEIEIDAGRVTFNSSNSERYYKYSKNVESVELWNKLRDLVSTKIRRDIENKIFGQLNKIQKDTVRNPDPNRVISAVKIKII
jgi:hypothetical protein